MKHLLTAALVAMSVMSAQAIEIDFGAVLNDQDEQPIMDCAKWGPPTAGEERKCLDNKVLTLGRAAFIALMTPSTEDQTATVDEKKRKGDLALTAYLNKPANVSVEDVAIILKWVGRQYGPLIIVRAKPLLDPPKK